MKIRMSMLSVALIMAMPALAKDLPLPQAAAIAQTVTPANISQPYTELEARSLHALLKQRASRTAEVIHFDIEAHLSIH